MASMSKGPTNSYLVGNILNDLSSRKYANWVPVVVNIELQVRRAV
jgi:hypothetical protein